MFLKLWLTILLVVILDTLGDLLISHGMKKIGPLKSLKIETILPFLKDLIKNIYLGLGLLSSALSFFIYLWLLSWTDLSVAVPGTALIYIFGTLGARFILNEHVSQARWLGILIIGFGVVLISFN